jgi:hypothetical protein
VSDSPGGPPADLDKWSDDDSDKWSDERWIEVLRVLYDNPDTTSPATAARAVGLPRSTVYDVLRARRESEGEDRSAFLLGVDGKRYLQRDCDYGQLFAFGAYTLNRRGWSYRRIAAALGTSHASVRRWIESYCWVRDW